MQLTEEAWLLDVSISVVRMWHKGKTGKGHYPTYCSDHLQCTPEAWLCVLGLVTVETRVRSALCRAYKAQILI